MKNKNKNPQIKLIGNNAVDVTGSMTLVTTSKGTQILLECGMIQGDRTVEEEYRENANALTKLDLDKIKYCFLMHPHGDHGLLYPRAVAWGMTAKIITTPISAKIIKELWLDGAFINQRNSEYLSKKYKRDMPPLYTIEDVYNTLNNVYEYDYNEIYELDDEVSFCFLKNSHVLGASSLELYIKDDSGRKHKLFYSSDLGNTAIKNRPYLSDMEYCRNANLCVFESTYGDREKQITKKDRVEELKQIEDIITKHCIEYKSKVIIPCFSFSRTQEIMTVLYQIFKDDEKFKDIDFVVDSRLTKNINKVYSEVLTGEDKKLFDEVLSWKNFKIISDYQSETTKVLSDRKPMVIISSSGFCEAGHIRSYLAKYVSNDKCGLIFCGYASNQSLGGRLRSDTKTISIDNRVYNKRIKVYVLESFSSHMQKQQLIDYICGINTEKVVLVHGSESAKQNLKQACDEKLSKICKTAKIVIGQKNLIENF